MILSLCIIASFLLALWIGALVKNGSLAKQLHEQETSYNQSIIGLQTRLKDADKWLFAANKRVEELEKYQDIIDAEYAAKRIIAMADSSANAIRKKVSVTMEMAKEEATNTLLKAQQIMAHTKGKYEGSIDKAVKEAERLVQRTNAMAVELTVEA